MPRVHVTRQTEISADRILEAARDFSDRRADRWPDVHVEHLEVHDSGDGFAEVSEGNPWPMGHVWERLRYDWSEPGSVRGVVIESNIFQPGSTWEIHATPTDTGTTVEVKAIRNLKGKGWLLYPFFPTGLAKKNVEDHLDHFLAALASESLE